MEAPEQLKAPVAKLVTVVTAMVGLLLAAVTLNYYYRSQRNGRAQRYSRPAMSSSNRNGIPRRLSSTGMALSISHTDENRLALGLALVKAGSLPEAEVYLREVLRDQPTSGPANLGLAEDYAARHQIDAAVAFYHQAIYGAWAGHPNERREQARMELVKALGAAGRDKQAQVELLAILQDQPATPKSKKAGCEDAIRFRHVPGIRRRLPPAAAG